MPTPQSTQIHIDQALTNVSVAYTNSGYVAEQIMPKLPVSKISDKWFVYDKSHFRPRTAKVAPGAIANEFNYNVSTGSYFATRRAERHLVLDADLQLQDAPLNEQVDATEFLSEQMALIREIDTAAFVANTSNLTNNTALSGTSQWTDYVNSTPLTNIKTAKASVRNNAAREANVMLISYEGALDLADHPSIKDLIKYTDPRSLTSSGLPPVIRGLRIIEASAVKDSAAEGATFSPVAVWANNVIIAYVSPGAGLRKVTLGWTFLAPDPTTGAQDLSTRTYRSEERQGTWVETAITYDLELVAAGAGYLFTGIY